MKAPRFDLAMIRRLVFKDWYVHRWALFFVALLDVFNFYYTEFAASPLSPYPVDLADHPIFLLNYSNTIGAGNFFFPHFVLMMVFGQEARAETRTFYSSLPIASRDGAVAQFLANLLLFLVPWLIVLTGVTTTIGGSPALPDGLIPFATIVLLATLAGYCLALAVIVTYGLNIGPALVAALLGSFLPMAFRSYLARVPELARAVARESAGWTSFELTMAAVLVATIGASLVFTCLAAARPQAWWRPASGQTTL